MQESLLGHGGTTVRSISKPPTNLRQQPQYQYEGEAKIYLFLPLIGKAVKQHVAFGLVAQVN